MGSVVRGSRVKRGVAMLVLGCLGLAGCSSASTESGPSTSGSDLPSASSDLAWLPDDVDLGAPIPRPSAGSPEAYHLADWVWDYVGPGWAITLYHPPDISGELADVYAVPAVYLVSPEGIYFLAFEFPDKPFGYRSLGITAIDDGGKGLVIHEYVGEGFCPVYAVDLVKGTMSEPEGRRVEQYSFPDMTPLPDGRFAEVFYGWIGPFIDAFTWSRSTGWVSVPISLPEGYHLKVDPFSGMGIATSEEACIDAWLSVDFDTGATQPLSVRLPSGDELHCYFWRIDSPGIVSVRAGGEYWHIALDGVTAPERYEPDSWDASPWYGDAETEAAFSLEFSETGYGSTDPLDSHLWYVGDGGRELVFGPEDLDFPIDGPQPEDFQTQGPELRAQTLGNGWYGIEVFALCPDLSCGAILHALFDANTKHVHMINPLFTSPETQSAQTHWNWIPEEPAEG